MLVWVKFAICLAVIVIAGTRLSKYGDLIAHKTGLGRIWIGVILLATATSLPELATGISSATLIGKPDLVLGDLFGANLMNLGIIALLDLLYRHGPVLRFLGTGIVLTTILSAMLIATAAIFLYIAQNVSSLGIMNYVGLYSIIFLCFYLLAQYILFRFERAQQGQASDNENELVADGEDMSLKKISVFFTIAALVTVGAGTWLGFIGNEISEVTGLTASFVGTLFLAICTTAPEMTVSISALRLGALDMAVGNLVGSCLFNLGIIIFVSDLFYAAGPIFSYVSLDHISTALFAVLMCCVVIIGLIFQPRSWPRTWVGVDTTILAILFLGAFAALYFM